MHKLARWFEGRKTIICARLYIVAGLILAAKDALSAYDIDITPYLPVSLGPTSPYWPFLIAGTGVLFESLRWVTRTPCAYLPYIEKDTDK